MTRKLAHIERVLDVQPIPNKDKIALATILGWKVIVDKNEIKKGDLVVYFEIDSLLPKEDQRFKQFEKVGYKIKTIKMAGVLSQGLAMPISKFTEIKKIKEGQDVTYLLGITKFEKYEDEKKANKNKKKNNSYLPFPNWIQKTDEERIQNMTKVLKDVEDKFYITEKLDGTSFTLFARKVQKRKYLFFKREVIEFGICTRNYQINMQKPNKDTRKYVDYVEKHDLKNKTLSLLNDKVNSVVLQGELIGPNIQQNNYKLTENKLYIFNIFINGQKIDYSLMQYFNNLFDIVPLFDRKTLKFDNIDDILNEADGNSLINKQSLREGFVIRSLNYDLSFKVISNKYLLKK